MHERILQKLDEIRQKPEHVRIWYVWACVFVVMFFVVVIWIFSLQENFRVAIPETAKEAGQALPKAAGQKSLDDLQKNDQQLTPDPTPSAANGQDYFNSEITRMRTNQ
jgi:cytoskeletal protein RodZ